MLCVHHCIFKLPLIHILLIFCLTGNAYIFLWTITVKVTSLTSDKGNICLTSTFLMCVFAFGGLELINSCDCPLAMWPRSKHTHTHTCSRPCHVGCYRKCPELEDPTESDSTKISLQGSRVHTSRCNINSISHGKSPCGMVVSGPAS